ncbi:prolyl oligopeptidase family serine peptidase [Vibrio sp. OCN044]|uniref:Prolyl oligopeptidase family serine peptidase n=1 Tax=Vibrio tetraodonis subsp. pristinus TaxID=2695891 RepID=A0A6L8LUP1_9VIBR|nr:dienelactone hydrolase family protein [Vibrio tetraodonis]MYM58906.1 prolyl oligopeptidase family serine peptidase [Vibrio tetraodonis subsp. pristinus]
MNIRLLTLTALLSTSTAMAGENKIYNVNGQEYEGYWAKTSEKAPLVLLIHDWDGLTDYEKKRAKMLNDLGYNVFAADLFGKGVRPTEVKDKKQHTGELYKDREKLRALVLGSLNYAKSLGADSNNVVVMGYCFGGAATLEAARSGMKAKGFVTFHGGLKTPEGQSYKDTSAPILVLHGTADSAITMDQFATLANELENENVDHEMITYSGAPHAFTVFNSERYREKADKKSWLRFTEFLESTTQ